jgi:FkbH-like protein
MGEKKVKCVVWDLDNTLWDGVLAETDNVILKAEAVNIIRELDRRGILQSISSKNEYSIAMKKLEEYGIAEYFLYPQISWNPKSEAITEIAASLNIGIDTFAFVDDSQFELEEVSFTHKEVLCIDATDICKMEQMEALIPKFITDDSKNRRKLYMNDIKRNRVEEEYKGGKEEFLKTLNMKFTISEAVEEDLKRVEELTVRTHQLNSTGTVYSYDELVEMIHSDKYMVLVAQLDDKYGSYGKIGISVIEKDRDIWNIKLLLMSCRVMSKSVGTVLMNFIMKEASSQGARLLADFVQTDRNRIMYITYKFNGFNEISNNNGHITFEANLEKLKPYPDYIQVKELFLYDLSIDKK